MMNPSIADQKTPLLGDILIVDDAPANLQLLSGILTERGHRARLAPNGKLALMNARSSPPDLILLDIMMPEMDGYAVCDALKADETTSDIPIIFISALDESPDKVRAFEAGGVDYVTKPFQAKEVIARVETHLALYELRQSLQAQIEELDAFAHTVAHDIKSPLGVIVSYADFLAEELEGSRNEEIRQNVNTLGLTAHKVANIVDELLLLSSVRKIEEVMVDPLDMRAIVAEALARLAAAIEESGTEMIVPDEWPLVSGYAPWIEEVWTNYISNAIKYGGRPDQGIPPRVELGFDELAERPRDKSKMHARPCGDSGQGDGVVRFWVRDNGLPLTAEEQSNLFKPFTRLRHVGVGGHGLGLSIVRRIMDKLGEQAGLESVEDEGNTFFFTLREPADNIS